MAVISKSLVTLINKILSRGADVVIDNNNNAAVSLCVLTQTF